MTAITMTPLDVALAFTKAWTNHDLEAAAKLVAEDVEFDGPLQQSTGAEPYLKGLASLSQEVKGMKMLAAFGDFNQALLMYDLTTQSYGVLTCSKLITVRDGKIQKDKLTFDSHKIRSVSQN